MQQLAERLAEEDLLVDGHDLVADLGRLQAEGGLAVVLREPCHDLGAGRDRLAEGRMRQRIERVLEVEPRHIGKGARRL